LTKWSIVNIDTKDNSGDELLSALNQQSEDDLVQDLYAGKSLRMIADENNGDFNEVVSLQIRQLKEQLDQRLASGSISAEQHAVHSSELEELVTESAHTAYSFV
jgi:hypothetical protein